MKTYKFDYTVTVCGRSRSSVKTLKAYSWVDASQRLAKHVRKMWFQKPGVLVNNAQVETSLINPDILPDIQSVVNAQIETDYKLSGV